MIHEQLEFYPIPFSKDLLDVITSNADKSIENINSFFVSNPLATIVARLKDNSYSGYGLMAGDTIVIDCSLQPTKKSNLCLLFLKGEFFIKQVNIREGILFMISAYNHIKPIEIIPELQIKIQGVITHIIRST